MYASEQKFAQLVYDFSCHTLQKWPGEGVSADAVEISIYKFGPLFRTRELCDLLSGCKCACAFAYVSGRSVRALRHRKCSLCCHFLKEVLTRAIFKFNVFKCRCTSS